MWDETMNFELLDIISEYHVCIQGPFYQLSQLEFFAEEQFLLLWNTL